MSWSRGEALTDPAVRQPLIFLSEFKFHLRDLEQEITVRLFQPVHSGRIIARCSHILEVPGLPAPDKDAPDDLETGGEGDALHYAVEDLLCVYNAARARDLAPDAAWLKPNPDFA